MRRNVILFLFIMLVPLTGCDFVRTVAGRPTSRDIENKRIEILRAEEAALQARLDSIRLAKEKVVTDSLAALDSLKVYGTMMTGAKRLGGLASADLSSRYYIVAGAFRDAGNAGKLVSMAEEKGYDAVLIQSRSGMVAVGLCPSDRIAVTVQALARLRNEAFCPKDAWIFVNER